MDHLRNAKFFFLLLDGSTNKGNIDNELILVVWCDVNGTDECVHTKMSFFRVSQPQFVSAEGLFTLVGHTLQVLECMLSILVSALSRLGLVLMEPLLTSLEWD